MHISKKIEQQIFDPELEFKATRSSGPGGQNINKVNTRITLRFDIKNSVLLEPAEKEALLQKLASRISNEGILIIDTQEKRTQLQNKELAVKKFYALLRSAFRPKKVRLKTKPGKAAIQKRLNEKKARSEKKQNRRKFE